jgi:hypothetical protein
MSEFSSTDAALDGLRVSREHPLAVLWWWGAYAAAALVELGVSTLPPFRRMAALMPQMQAEAQAVQANPSDPAATAHYLSLLGQAAPAILAFAAVALVMHVVLMTGVLRAVLRPTDRAVGYLRLSMDEARQVGLALIAVVVFLGYAFVVSLISTFVTAVVGGIVGGGALAFAFGGLVFVGVALAFLYPAVRLSLAPAMTFADGRISLFRSWALTRGRFWPLFGAYLVAGTFAVMIMGFVLVAGMIVSSRVGGPPLDDAAGLLSPLKIGLFLFNALFAALLGAVTTAPGASAFRQLTGRMGAPAVSSTSSGSPWGQA